MSKTTEIRHYWRKDPKDGKMKPFTVSGSEMLALRWIAAMNRKLGNNDMWHSLMSNANTSGDDNE